MNKAPISKTIFVRGASAHNLQNVDIGFATNKISVVCGVSGSGKSSFISECLLAESKLRRDVTALRASKLTPPYCPDLSSARVPRFISVDQGVVASNERSTVGTYSGLLDSIRVIALNGQDSEIRDRANEVLTQTNRRLLGEWLFDTRVVSSVAIYATLARRVSGKLWDRFCAELPIELMDSVIVVESGSRPESGKPRTIKALRSLKPKTYKDVFVLTGANIQCKSRFAFSYEVAERFACQEDDIIICIENEGGTRHSFHLKHLLFSKTEAEPYFRITEPLLSFNSDADYSGKCGECEGVGFVTVVPATRLVANDGAPLATGGVALPYSHADQRYKYLPSLAQEIMGFLVHEGYGLDASWNDLNDKSRQRLLKTGTEEPIQPLYSNGRPKGKRKRFEPINSQILRLNERDPTPNAVSEMVLAGQCPACEGLRFNQYARSTHIGGMSLSKIIEMPMSELAEFAGKRHELASSTPTKLGWSRVQLLAGNMVKLGLGHLSMSRSTDSLSGGEGQRLRIGRTLLEQNRGVGYVFDEPTRGMHYADSNRLVATLRSMLDRDVAIVLVDHNRNVVRQCDHVVELGPGSGIFGGHVIHAGLPLDAPMLQVDIQEHKGASWINDALFKFTHISKRTIAGQCVAFPLGSITCIAGVSGSGKSTLMKSVIYPALIADGGLDFASVELPASEFDVLYLSQGKVNRNPRSSLATFLDVADELREWFYQESGARNLGLNVGAFSPNVDDSQCGRCLGLGVESWTAGTIHCATCDGTGLRATALLPKAFGKTFADWINLSCEQLAEHSAVPENIRAYASICSELKLGHLALGRRVPTLSGGESQRLRIVKALGDARAAEGSNRHVILLLDEPAAGLHPTDVSALIQTLKRTKELLMCTFVLVEHSLDVINASDWLIEMGPGSAEEGGRVVFCGEVERFLSDKSIVSATKRALVDSSSSPTDVHDQASDLDKGSNVEPLKPLGIATRNPEYVVIDGNLAENARRKRVCDVLGITSPLLDIFSCQLTHKFDQASAVEAALEVWRDSPRQRLLAWFPLTAKLEHQALIYDDFRAEISKQLRTLADGWFDGRSISSKAPTKNQAVGMRRARLVRKGPVTETAVIEALQLGCGWISIVDTETGAIFDFTTRPLSLKELRVGPRKLFSFSLDPRHPEGACRVCRGVGSVATPAVDLLFRPRNSEFSRIEDCLTDLAKRVFRKSGIRDINREIRKFEHAGLVDLTRANSADWQNHSAWIGFPDREILKPGGDPKKVSDWIRWKGIAAEAIVLARAAHVSKDDRELILSSVAEQECPRCAGTGLGWSARNAEVDSVRLQSILKSWTASDLKRWISTVKTVQTHSIDASYSTCSLLEHLEKLSLGDMEIGARLEELSSSDLAAVKALVATQYQLMFSEITVGSELRNDQKAYILSLGRSYQSAKWIGDNAH